MSWAPWHFLFKHKVQPSSTKVGNNFVCPDRCLDYFVWKAGSTRLVAWTWVWARHGTIRCLPCHLTFSWWYFGCWYQLVSSQYQTNGAQQYADQAPRSSSASTTSTRCLWCLWCHLLPELRRKCSGATLLQCAYTLEQWKCALSTAPQSFWIFILCKYPWSWGHLRVGGEILWVNILPSNFSQRETRCGALFRRAKFNHRCPHSSSSYGQGQARIWGKHIVPVFFWSSN